MRHWSSIAGWPLCGRPEKNPVRQQCHSARRNQSGGRRYKYSGPESESSATTWADRCGEERVSDRSVFRNETAGYSLGQFTSSFHSCARGDSQTNGSWPNDKPRSLTANCSRFFYFHCVSPECERRQGSASIAANSLRRLANRAARSFGRRLLI